MPSWRCSRTKPTGTRRADARRASRHSPGVHQPRLANACESTRVVRALSIGNERQAHDPLRVGRHRHCSGREHIPLRAVRTARGSLEVWRASCLTTQTANDPAPVLGGGFAGIGATHELKKADVDIVVVDKHDYHTFQPLAAPAGDGPARDDGRRALAPRPRQRPGQRHDPQGAITGITSRRRKSASTVSRPSPTTSSSSPSGAGELLRDRRRRRARVSHVHAARRGQAQDHVLGRWEAGIRTARSSTTRVDGRGGRRRADRVETAGALPSFTGQTSSRLSEPPQEKARVVLVEAGDEIFAMLKPTCASTQRTRSSSGPSRC